MPWQRLVVLVAALAVEGDVLACWICKDWSATQSFDGRYTAVQYADGGVVVEASSHPGAPEWTMRFASWSCIFDAVVVGDQGRAVARVRDNHAVGHLGDLAVEILRRDGRRWRLPARRFVRRLVPSPSDRPRSSAEPAVSWMRGLRLVDDETLEIVTADDRSVRVGLTDGAVHEP